MDAYVYVLNVHHGGMFLFAPLRYNDHHEVLVETTEMPLRELVHYIEAQVGDPINTLYYLTSQGDMGSIMKLRTDRDVEILFTLAHTYGTMQVYCDHLGTNLDDYIQNERGQPQEEIEVEEHRESPYDTEEQQNEDGDNDDEQTENNESEDQNDNNDLEEQNGNNDQGQTSRQTQDGEYDSDEEYVAEEEDSDEESLASLDHLSEGEDEVREVRQGRPIARIPTSREVPTLNCEQSKVGKEKKNVNVLQEEHDAFLKDLVEAMTNMGDGTEYLDPLLPPPEDPPVFPVHDKATHWRLKKPKVGEKYESPEQLKECLTYYALANGYSIWYERSAKTTIIARCGNRPPKISDPSKGKQTKDGPRYHTGTQGCKFRLYATWMTSERTFQIRTLDEVHTCSRNFRFGSLVNYKWIGRHFAERIRQQPDIKLCVIQDLVMKKYKCHVTHTQVKRARAWALTEYERSLEEHYALLRPYADALLRTNPGSTVEIGTTPNPDGTVFFDRMYVCLFGLKQGWRLGCRYVVALDGCFLKNSCNGELLTAVGRDGNNQVYPIAWAIVGVENKENWTWFLRLLENDLGFPQGDNLTLMSDQHKGLIEAVKEIMPRAGHRQCARHIYENFKKIYSGEAFRNLFWRACKATYPAQFEEVMKEIKAANPNAFKYLMDRNPKSWSRAFFWLHTGCEAVENGFSECWNSVLLKVRNKPIITLLESLRVILMIRLETLREQSSRWEHDVCPSIRKKLDTLKNERGSWLTIHAGGNKFEVRNYKYAYGVDLDGQECDCRLWQMSGIPCVHAMHAMFKVNKDPESYISAWFRMPMYRMAYGQYLNPVGGIDTWTVNPEHNVSLPPKPRSMPGRPKKNRVRAASEPKVHQRRVTRHGAVMTCSRCWQRGHNVRGCTNEPVPRPSHVPRPRGKRGRKLEADEAARKRAREHEPQTNEDLSAPPTQETNNDQLPTMPSQTMSQPLPNEPMSQPSSQPCQPMSQPLPNEPASQVRRKPCQIRRQPIPNQPKTTQTRQKPLPNAPKPSQPMSQPLPNAPNPSQPMSQPLSNAPKPNQVKSQPIPNQPKPNQTKWTPLSRVPQPTQTTSQPLPNENMSQPMSQPIANQPKPTHQAFSRSMSQPAALVEPHPKKRVARNLFGNEKNIDGTPNWDNILARLRRNNASQKEVSDKVEPPKGSLKDAEGQPPKSNAQPPISPGSRVGVTKGGFRYALPKSSGSSGAGFVKVSGTKLGIKRGGNAFPRGRGGHTVAFGRTTSWLGSGVETSGTLIQRVGPQEVDERVTVTAPTRNTTINPRTKKAATPKKHVGVKTRTPSQRILLKKLGKKVEGPGSTYDSALPVSEEE